MPKKILVIDDEEILTRTFARLFGKQGYHVTVATSSEEAIRRVKEGDFDLILSDIRMPGKNGVETAVEIASVRAGQGKENIPIIFLTGFADEQSERKAQELKPIAYLYKPFDSFRLLDIVQTHLQQRQEPVLKVKRS